MSTTFATRAAFVSALALALTSAPPAGAERRDHESREILTIDHAVPHVSTVPANAGEDVVLFVRERVLAEDVEKGEDVKKGKDGRPFAKNRHKRRGRNEVVLFVHGGTVPSVPDFDLPFENYSWAEFLVERGFHVFMMDQSGYGFSPRPEMDDPCNVNPDDQELIIPNPLEEPCDHSYPFNLTTRQSDWDEIHSVVEYIQDLTGARRLNLVGWSAGVPRIGGYAVLHPENVDKLYMYAGSASATAPSEPPAEVPAPGWPMNFQTHDELMHGRWDSEVGCEDQFDPAVRPVVWNTIMSFDPLGSTWGTPPWNPVASPEGGLMRTRTATNWGWNLDTAAMITAPTLSIVGEFDDPDRRRQLHEALGSQRKVFIEVACASHFLVWENQHKILLETSEEWFRKGKIDGVRKGEFSVDEFGQLNEQ